MQVSIVPLILIHPLLHSPLLSLTISCHLMSSQVTTMGLDRLFVPFVEWIIAQNRHQEAPVKYPTSVDLRNVILQPRKYLKFNLVPKSPPSLPPAPIQYFTSLSVVTEQLAAVKPHMVPSDRHGFDMRSLLRICNVTSNNDIPPI